MFMCNVNVLLVALLLIVGLKNGGTSKMAPNVWWRKFSEELAGRHTQGNPKDPKSATMTCTTSAAAARGA